MRTSTFCTSRLLAATPSFAIHNASHTQHDHGMGTRVVTAQTHLHGPLGLVRAANGDLISAQGDARDPRLG
jgi:hypothetical protein